VTLERLLRFKVGRCCTSFPLPGKPLPSSEVADALAQFAVRGVWLSLYLGIFNLLPVPPLDGSKLLLAARIPMAIYMEISRFGFMLLIVAVSVSDFGRWMSEWSIWGTRAIPGALQ
jgi:Zn-dependent protease